jgi:hypothetical protein
MVLNSSCSELLLTKFAKSSYLQNIQPPQELAEKTFLLITFK